MTSSLLLMFIKLNMAAYQEPWKKVLYIKQNYPDNYLDEEQFKKDLKENLNVQIYEFPQAAMASLSALHEVNSVCLFVLAFWLLDEHKVSLPVLFGIIAVCILATWRFTTTFPPSLTPFPLLTTKTTPESDTVVQSLLLLIFLCGISPVLTTLTESISTDTIWFLTVVMFLVHLLFHDYGGDAPIVSVSFSLNAAIFSAVCLASRLHSALQTLVIMLLAILLFALLPNLRNQLQSRHPTCVCVMALVTSIITGGLVFSVFSFVGVLVYVVQSLFIAVVCPYWFVRFQHIKRTINGPWDLAMVNLS